MRLLLFASIHLFSLAGLTHPLHLSVANIDIRNDSVIISIRVFADDFYANLLTQTSTRTEQLRPSFKDSITNQAISYIQDKFSINYQDTTIQLNFNSLKEDDLSVWYYFDGKIPNPKGKIIIENRILTEYFGDQKNLVIIQIGNEQTGLEFNNTTINRVLEIN